MNHVTSLIKVPFYLFNRYLPSSETDRFYKNNYLARTESVAKNGVIFMCDGKINQGGLTDRLRGLLTIYENASRHNLPFYVNWTSPFQLRRYLCPVEVDWTIDPEEISYDKRFSFPVLLFERIAEKYQDKWNQIWLDSVLAFPKKQVHVYSNCNNSKGRYSQLFPRLFRPSDELQSKLDVHLENLGHRYVSFSFRFQQLLGDFKDTYGTILPESERSAFIAKVLDEVKSVLSTIPETHRVLVASDSTTFLDAVRKISPRIYTVEGKISHVDLNQDGKDAEDVWMKTFLDMFLVMNADKVYLFRTGEMYNSGFPRFAAEVGGKPFIYHEFS